MFYALHAVNILLITQQQQKNQSGFGCILKELPENAHCG